MIFIFIKITNSYIFALNFHLVFYSVFQSQIDIEFLVIERRRHQSGRNDNSTAPR